MIIITTHPTGSLRGDYTTSCCCPLSDWSGVENISTEEADGKH